MVAGDGVDDDSQISQRGFNHEARDAPASLSIEITAKSDNPRLTSQ